MRTATLTDRSVPATEPQLRFLADLSRDRDVPAALADDLATALPTLTKAGASGYITRLKECRYAPRPAAAPAAPQDDAAPAPAPAAAVAVAAVADVAKGDVLIAGSTVIRVQQSRSTGNLYALTRETSDATGSFTYAPGLLRRLPADARRLTTAEATALSAASARSASPTRPADRPAAARARRPGA